MHSIQTKQKGFTLIELLLYLSLAVIMMAVLGGIGINVLASKVKARSQEELQYNAQFITEKIRASIDSSTAITSPGNGATSSVLTLQMKDASKSPTTIDVQDGVVRMQEGSGTPLVLSGSNIVVTALEFHNATAQNSPGTIRSVLHIEAYNPQQSTAYAASSTFYTTATIRYTP